MNETLYQNLVNNKDFRFIGTDNDKYCKSAVSFAEDNGGEFNDCLLLSMK